MLKNTKGSVNLSITLRKTILLGTIISVLLLSFSACSFGVKKDLTLATTTSVNDSGLMDYLKPVFEKDTGMNLKIISQGTGQAVKTGQDGNADVLLIHDKASEEKFVSEGYGLERIELACNYFVVVGPQNDSAGLLDQKLTAADAFKKIAESQSPFVSRGDDSGTHKKELKIWKQDSIKPVGDWYISAGKGMGAVLSMADEKMAYTLTDKATYLSMKDKLDLQIVVDATPDLLNQYTIIEVNPDKHEGINKAGADKFVKWITSEKALNMINEFGKDKYGESLFQVNYKK